MAFLCGENPNSGVPDDDDLEIDEQPTTPLPAAFAPFADPEAMVDTQPTMTAVELIVHRARELRAARGMEHQIFCSVCLRFNGVEDHLEPVELTERLRPVLCEQHLARFLQHDQWKRLIDQQIIRNSIHWYLWPPGSHDFD